MALVYLILKFDYVKVWLMGFPWRNWTIMPFSSVLSVDIFGSLYTLYSVPSVACYSWFMIHDKGFQCQCYMPNSQVSLVCGRSPWLLCTWKALFKRSRHCYSLTSLILAQSSLLSVLQSQACTHTQSERDFRLFAFHLWPLDLSASN